METIEPISLRAASPSQWAKTRMQRARGEPLFIADWDRVLMIHFRVDAKRLQHDVPFELDLWDDRAFVTLVEFTMRGMRPAFGGCVTSWVFRPIATHDFLNVRTYVQHHGERGIHFLIEWLSNPFSLYLGPCLFSLPYRLGRLEYEHHYRDGTIRGKVRDWRDGGRLDYKAALPSPITFERRTIDSSRYWRFSCVPI